VPEKPTLFVIGFTEECLYN